MNLKTSKSCVCRNQSTRWNGFIREYHNEMIDSILSRLVFTFACEFAFRSLFTWILILSVHWSHSVWCLLDCLTDCGHSTNQACRLRSSSSMDSMKHVQTKRALLRPLNRLSQDSICRDAFARTIIGEWPITVEVIQYRWVFRSIIQKLEFDSITQVANDGAGEGIDKKSERKEKVNKMNWQRTTNK